ncbi:MAG: ExbD/TolR family protein [Planctomycetota bacterium]
MGQRLGRGRSFGSMFCNRPGGVGLNMTPVIDIVFLLIVFFLVVCKFIEAENFPVSVPDDCEFAQSNPEPRVQAATVAVMKRAGEEIAFAVGSEEISASTNADDIVEKLAELIDVRVKDFPPERRVVTLRIDKDICFADAQYVLAGVAASAATDIQLAALKGKRSDWP